MVQSLEEFWAAYDWQSLQRIADWTVTREEQDKSVIVLEVSARDQELYRLRCVCDDYPDEPPRVAFVNSANSKSDTSVWPKGNDEFHKIVKVPPASFLCVPLTREGVQHHPEWRGRWKDERRTLLDVFNLVTRLLQGTDYTSRSSR